VIALERGHALGLGDGLLSLVLLERDGLAPMRRRQLGQAREPAAARDERALGQVLEQVDLARVRRRDRRRALAQRLAGVVVAAGVGPAADPVQQERLAPSLNQRVRLT
jgi:hypothetical protein